ncbi:MAG: hypothetical protein COC15_02655, partial [Legionellales bacterium]
IKKISSNIKAMLFKIMAGKIKKIDLKQICRHDFSGNYSKAVFAIFSKLQAAPKKSFFNRT